MSEESEANVVDLTAAVTGLSTTVTNMRSSQKKTNRLARLAIAGFTLDVLLTLFVGGLFHRVDHNANTIRSVQCSFYGLVLGNYHPETRPAGLDRDTYIAQFKTIQSDSGRLNCPRR